MRLSTNVTALAISTQMSKTNRRLMTSSMRLSSGLKVNHAKDDPAGYSIARRLETNISIAEKNQENYQDGVSLMQTVDSSLAAVGDILQRARELSVQAASDTLTNDDRAKIQTEIEQLKEEINSMSDSASFNGINFMSGDSTRLTYPSGDVSYSYVSGNVPEGLLKYDINSYGEPATVDVDFSSLISDPTATVGTSGTIDINGYVVEIEPFDTNEEALNKIKTACDSTNIDFFEPETAGDPYKLVTRGEGSDEIISISTSPSGFLGLTDVEDTGVDADITFHGLYNIEDGTTEIPSFNNGISIEIDGNDITFNGRNSQCIEASLDFELDEFGEFVTGATGLEESEILDYGQLKIQSGDNKQANVDIYFRRIDTETLGIDEINLSTVDGATKAMEEIDDAISTILTYRAEIGAYQNRMESANEALESSSINMETYLSTIQDTDIAYEMSYLTNQSVIMQASISVLAQANQRPQQILSLLG